MSLEYYQNQIPENYRSQKADKRVLIDLAKKVKKWKNLADYMVSDQDKTTIEKNNKDDFDEQK